MNVVRDKTGLPNHATYGEDALLQLGRTAGRPRADKSVDEGDFGRDYDLPVGSSRSIPTILLMVPRAMNSAPRLQRPTARDATQKTLRRDNVNQLSSHGVLALAGMAGRPGSTDKACLDSFFKGRDAAA